MQSVLNFLRRDHKLLRRGHIVIYVEIKVHVILRNTLRNVISQSAFRRVPFRDQGCHFVGCISQRAPTKKTCVSLRKKSFTQRTGCLRKNINTLRKLSMSKYDSLRNDLYEMISTKKRLRRGRFLVSLFRRLLVFFSQGVRRKEQAAFRRVSKSLRRRVFTTAYEMRPYKKTLLMQISIIENLLHIYPH